MAQASWPAGQTVPNTWRPSMPAGVEPKALDGPQHSYGTRGASGISKPKTKGGARKSRRSMKSRRSHRRGRTHRR